MKHALGLHRPGWGGTLESALEIALKKATLSEPPPPMTTENKDDGWSLATATAYDGKDDIYGSVTSRPNPDGKFEAIDGVTVAVDPNVIPYNSWIEVRFKDGTIKRFHAGDTGSAVKARTASIGRGNLDAGGNPIPVLDFYHAAGNLNAFNDEIGNVVEWRIARA